VGKNRIGEPEYSIALLIGLIEQGDNVVSKNKVET
jgi:hypothetical protein